MMSGTSHSQGLRYFFGIPGSGPVMDMMEVGRQRGVAFLSTANEASAAIAAAYYGRLKGTAGLSISIKGAGAGNLVAGAVNAYLERMPVVCVAESIPTAVALDEVNQRIDQRTLFGAVAKQVSTFGSGSARELIAGAFAAARNGRPGPVLLELPADMGTASAHGAAVSIAPASTRVADVTESGVSPAANVDEAATFVGALRRPVLVIGLDGAHARLGAAVLELAESLAAAVMVTPDARGAVPEDHPRFAGVFACLASPAVLGNRVLTESDGAVLIGVDPIIAEAPFPRGVRTCELVADRAYQTLSPTPDVRVNGPLTTTVAALRKALGATGALSSDRHGWDAAAVRSLRQEIAPCFVRPGSATLAVHDVLEVARELLPRHGVLFSETSAFVLHLEYLWQSFEPDTFFGSVGGRTMGLMLPALLGGKLAEPERPMLGIGADGSLLMRLGELETFARSGAAAPIVIINDGAYGTIKARQRIRGLPEYGLDLSCVDYAQVASALGLAAATITDPEQLRPALQQAMQADRATLIDVRVDPRPYQDGFGPTTGVAVPV